MLAVRCLSAIFAVAKLRQTSRRLRITRASRSDPAAPVSRPSTEWTGKKGYVQNFLSETGYKEIPTTFYLCGNGGMIKESKHQLLEIDGLDKTRVWAEAFD